MSGVITLLIMPLQPETIQSEPMSIVAYASKNLARTLLFQRKGAKRKHGEVPKPQKPPH